MRKITTPSAACAWLCRGRCGWLLTLVADSAGHLLVMTLVGHLNRVLTPTTITIAHSAAE